LKARQQLALDYLRQHGRFTRADYQKLTSASYRTAVREINQLLNGGYVRRGGGGRHWWYEAGGGG
jgi:Fic family protein